MRVMETVGEYADLQWAEHGAFIAGAKGFESTRIRSIKMSHPAFPIFMYDIGLMLAMSNGATVDIWGTPDPIALCVLNVNHSQTRKSRLTGDAEAYTAVIDKVGADSLQRIWDVKNQSLAACQVVHYYMMVI